MPRFLKTVVAAVAFVSLCAGAAGAEDRNSTRPTRVQGTIADIAVATPSLSTLVTALSATNLVSTLQGPGPFTVFAPTNDAFAKIPSSILSYLLSAPDVLSQVLLYHVVPGRIDLRYAIVTTPFTTVQGQKVFGRTSYRTSGATIIVNNSQVVLRPIVADNGIIYVIDSVLQPQFR
ncbi:MAG: fasciclin domain-containing protein [Vicinamibacterales bacterium]